MYKVVRNNLNEETLFNSFLPSLKGSVFHFTFEDSWHDIKNCGQLVTNKNGKFGYGSVHSHNSMGNHLGAICLFDLREVENSKMDYGTIFWDYFHRRVRSKPCYFLVLDSKSYSDIMILDDIDEKLRKEKMYIPDIESWHKGNLSLEKITTVHEVICKRNNP